MVSEELQHSAAPNVVEFRSAEERDKAAEIRALSSILLERYQFARQAGITFGGKRDLYDIFGYTRVLTTADYCDRYARGGLAKKIVDCLPNATWRGEVEVIEDEDPKVSTEFEKAADNLNRQLNAHAYLQRADILSQLGFYSVMLIGAPGDSDLNTELPKGKPGQLLYLQPYAGGGGPGVGVGGFNRRTGVGSVAAFGDATIMSFDLDVNSKRFSQPMYYQLRRMDISSASFTTQVHWSRIIHLADGCLDNDVYGVPSLEAVYNLLDDLDKVTGGGSESYFQKAKAGLHVDIDKTMGLPGNGPELKSLERDKLKDKLEEYKHELSSLIMTRGTTIKELGGTPSNFGPEADAIITQIAGTKGIPKRVLTGSEMGELASSQDRENFKDIVNGRQSSYAGPYIVRRFYDRLIDYGYLPKPKQYSVKWAHIQTLTEAEKSTGAKDWASTNQVQGAVVFTENQIREHWYQMEPLSDEEEAQGLTEIQKGQLAVSMTNANKTQGATIFIDDEIRQTSFGLTPLTPEQKVPITAPERVSATAPTPPDDAGPVKNPPVKMLGPVQTALETAVAFGRAALDVQELRAAMAAGDKDTTAAVLRAAADAVGRALREKMPEVMK